MEVKREKPAAVGFVGWSGSGKTTLLEQLLPVLRSMGLKTGYLKGSRAFEIDREGKDSDRLFKKWAERVLIASPTEAALRFRLQRRDVHSLLEEHFSGCDLVVVEGFRESNLPKIEICQGRAVLPDGDPSLVALVSDDPDPRSVPRFCREDVAAIARFVVETALAGMPAVSPQERAAGRWDSGRMPMPEPPS